MRHRRAIMLGAALLGGCVAPPETGSPGDQTGAAAAPAIGRQAVRPLLQEYNSGHGDPTRRVISDPAAFRAAWEQAFAGRGEQPALPAVDFARESVILAALGTQRSGGYTIDIDSVRVTADAFEVFVRTTSPGPTCGATAALTEPVVMVAAPRSALPPRFHDSARQTDCG